MQITSPANPRVKALVGLRRRRARDEAGLTLVDGYDELRLAVDAGARPTTVYVCGELVTDESRLALRDRLAAMGAEVVELGAHAFAKASYRESPDGWLASVPAPGRSVDELSLDPDSLVVVAESVEKPGNLGAMLRTAEAAGVAAVIAAPPGTDWGNPNVVRASKGTVFALPVASATAEQAIDVIRGAGLRVVVASPDGTATMTDADLAGGVAIVVGAEHAGVGDAWRQAADEVVHIPMAGTVNSLNVATSAALLLFEAVRQRSA